MSTVRIDVKNIVSYSILLADMSEDFCNILHFSLPGNSYSCLRMMRLLYTFIYNFETVFVFLVKSSENWLEIEARKNTWCKPFIFEKRNVVKKCTCILRWGRPLFKSDNRLFWWYTLCIGHLTWHGVCKCAMRIYLSYNHSYSADVLLYNAVSKSSYIRYVSAILLPVLMQYIFK